MGTKHWVLSAILAWHVVAVVVGSLTSSDEPPPPIRRSPQQDTGPLAAALTPAFDSTAAAVQPFFTALLETLSPLERLTGGYLRMLGLRQSWRMFVDPLEVHQYLRVRYYVATDPAHATGAEWTATELVLPAHREDEVRLVAAYWDHFRDKSLTASLTRFRRDRVNRRLTPSSTSAELPDDLAPVARYFARRFQRDALGPDDRIVRTEVWSGFAPIAAPGAVHDASMADAHAAAIREYYQGRQENYFGHPVHRPYLSAEREADITWVLEYFEP